MKPGFVKTFQSSLKRAEMLCIISSIAMSIAYIFSRYPFPTLYSQLILVMCLTVLLIRLPRFLANLSIKYTDNIFCAAFLTCPLLLLVGFFSNDFFQKIFFILIIPISITTLLFLIKDFIFDNSVNRKISLALILLAFVLGWYMAVKVWGVEYLSPLMLEKIAITRGHQDTLFHLALSHIFLSTSVVSTGLDQAVFIPYHAGSHIWLASIAKLLNLHVMEGYGMAYPIIVFPLLIQGITVSMLLLRYLFYGHDDSVFSSESLVAWWGVLLVFIVGLLPLKIQTETSLSRIVFFSESYVIASAFVLLSFPLFALLLKDISDLSKESSSWFQTLLFTATIFCWSIILGYIKISHAFFIPLLCFYFWIRGLIPRQLSFLAWCSSSAAILVLLSVLHLPDHSPTVSLLHQFMAYVQDAWKGWWPIIGFGWTWIVILLAYFHRSKSKYLAELAVLLTLWGLIPGMFLAFPGANANYFLDLPRWICIIFVGVLFRPKFLSIPKPIVAIGVLLLSGPIIVNILLQTQTWYFYHLEIKSQFLSIYGAKTLANSTRSTNNAEIYASLVDMSNSNEKELLFIPREHQFWKQPYACDVLPLVAPALSGKVQINGLPAEYCSKNLFAHRVYPVSGGYENIRIKEICQKNPVWKVRELMSNGDTKLICNAI